MALIGLLLTIPCLYLILISILKYVVGLPLLFDAGQSITAISEIKEMIGWDINLLILFGPFA